MQEQPVKIGYLILAHENSEQVSRMVRILSRGNSRIVIHLDASVQGQQRADFLCRVRESGEVEEAKAVECRWGDWSLVEATLSGLEQFQFGSDPVMHVVLLSGSHFPIRSPRELEHFLADHPDTDFIEAHDAQKTTWVKGGMNLERFQYFFPLNLRSHRSGFNFLTLLQKKIGFKRTPPEGLIPHLGSQWWCLRFSTCAQILEYLRSHPRVKRYFKSTRIPDESFFQTLVMRLCKKEEVANVPFALHALAPNGRPYVFHNDHASFLTGERHHFFARKLSPYAEMLFQALESRASDSEEVETLGTIPALLAGESSELDSRINFNYQLQGPMPGHLNDYYHELFLEIEQPIFVILADSITDAQADQIYKTLGSIPDLLFLGRPFRKDVVEFFEMMEELGLGDKSFEIRDRYTCQLFCEFFSRRQNGIVLMVDPDQDFESWVSFSNLKNYFPICIADSNKPRYRQLSFLNQVRNYPWGINAVMVGDGEIASYINSLHTKGELQNLQNGGASSGDIVLAQGNNPAAGKVECDRIVQKKNCFVILTYPRSGSYLLVDLLNQVAGVRCHGEIFKKERIELDDDLGEILPWSVEQRDQKPLLFLSKIFELSEDQSVGFKLFSSHNKDIIDYLLGADSIAKIILKRNVIDVYISFQRVGATGIWVDKGDRAVPESTAFQFDPDIFDRHYAWHQSCYRRFEAHAREQPDRYLLIDYEEVVDRSAFEKICPFLGVSVSSPESLVSKLKKQSIEPIEDLVINLEEMVSYVRKKYPELYPFLKRRVEMG